MIVVGANQVTALRLDNGQPAWSQPLSLPEGSLPSGRGVCGADHYYLPLTDASIAQIDLSAGTIASAARSYRGHTAGNLIWHRGRLISQGTEHLEAFADLATVQQQIETALAKNPNDPQALAQRAEVRLAEGKLPLAIEDFRRAHQVKPTSQRRNRLVSALLDGVYGKLPGAAKMQQELDRLNNALRASR